MGSIKGLRDDEGPRSNPGDAPSKIPAGRINGLVHYTSEVRTGTNWEGKHVVQLLLSVSNYTSRVSVDRLTAARLINQLRRALDGDPEGSAGL